MKSVMSDIEMQHNQVLCNTITNAINKHKCCVKKLTEQQVDILHELCETAEKIGGAIIEYKGKPFVLKAQESAKDDNFLKIKIDHYTEWQKWVGRLCWFWDGNSNRQFGVLTGINKNDEYIFIRNHSDVWKHCEPIKPDDDLIYKG